MWSFDNFTNELEAFHNASGNATKPYNENEVIHELVMSWLGGSNLHLLPYILIVFGWVMFFLNTQALRYTFWQVIATLAIVEGPQASYPNDRDRYKDKEDDDSKLLFTEKRVYTTSIRTILRHLYRIGGPTAFFRGFAICIPYYLVFYTVCSAAGFFLSITHIVPPEIFQFKEGSHRTNTQYILHHYVVDSVANIAGTAAAVHFSTAFTHIVITKPSFRNWFQRMPPLRATVSRVVPAVIAYELANYATFSLPNVLRIATGLVNHASAPVTNPSNSTAEDSTLASNFAAITAAPSWTPAQKVLAAAIWALAQAARFSLLVPAGVALVRVQAALLPEDDEPLVPMDRSFGAGGPAPPGILGAPVALGFGAAWRSVGRADMRRILVLYAKFLAVEVVLKAAFWPLLGRGVWPYLGSAWNPSLGVFGF